MLPLQKIDAAINAERNDEAKALAEALVKAHPQNGAAWNALGVVLRILGQPSAAVAAYTRSLEYAPDEAGVLSNLGNAWRDLQMFERALACHRAALERAPQSAKYWENFGVALRDDCRYSEALAAYDKAVALDPQSPRTRLDRSQILLMLGRYGEGWPEFEWRWQTPELKPPPLAKPRWDGSVQPDATLLLWPEQGFGDTILCARFVAQARERVGRIVLVCQPELLRLLTGIPGVDLVIPYGNIPSYDVHAPLMSLPRFFAPSPQDIPPPARLTVPSSSRSKLASIIAASDGLKVGVVWSGSVTFKGNKLRATTLDRFLRLAAVPGIRLFSLQKGPRAGEVSSSGAAAVMTDLAPHLEDFADTAAAIERLDLVVMTDSSVAHLAGSLGRPIWNLLPRMPYWLYGPEADSTAWYPSMRLFRQGTDGDWEAVFTDVEAALRDLIGRQGPQRRS